MVNYLAGCYVYDITKNAEPEGENHVKRSMANGKVGKNRRD